jgi:putative transcriptional regulator
MTPRLTITRTVARKEIIAALIKIRLERCAALLLCLPLLLLALRGAAVETGAPAVFLVAKPELQDPNFAQSVVLVVFPKEGGPVGVIINRPTKLSLKDGFPEQPQLKDRGDALYFGGPVKTNGLMFLFRSGSPADNAFPVIEDLYLSGDGELLHRLLAQKATQVQRFFLGYAGWSGPQLEHEIALGAWFVVEADLDTVIRADPKTLWRDLLRRATAVKT